MGNKRFEHSLYSEQLSVVLTIERVIPCLDVESVLRVLHLDDVVVVHDNLVIHPARDSLEVLHDVAHLPLAVLKVIHLHFDKISFLSSGQRRYGRLPDQHSTSLLQ